MRLLLIGDSHCAAVMDAQAAQPGRWPGLTLVARPLPGSGFRQLRIEGGRFVTADADTRARMARLWGEGGERLPAADAVAIVAAPPRDSLAEIAATLRAPLLPSGAALVAALNDAARADAALAGAGDGVQILPDALLRDAALRIAGRAMAAVCLRLVAPALAPGTAVAAAPSPMPPVRVWQALAARGGAAALARARARGDLPALESLLAGALREALHKVAGGRGLRLRPVAQPAGTLSPDGAATLPEWTDAPALLTRAGKPADNPLDAHANAAYGARLLDAIVAALRG